LSLALVTRRISIVLLPFSGFCNWDSLALLLCDTTTTLLSLAGVRLAQMHAAGFCTCAFYLGKRRVVSVALPHTQLCDVLALC
jgi:uncharacterized membrane protein (Fun14 family)